MEQPVSEQVHDSAYMRDTLLALLELTEEEFLQQTMGLVDNRLQELEASSDVVSRLDGLDGGYKGFLHPDTELNPAVDGTGFQLDDPQIYTDLLKNLYKLCQGYGVSADEPGKYRAALMQAVQYGQQDYFGNVRPSGDELKMREEKVWRGAILSGDEDSEPYQPASIAEFKNIAMCAERAAVANNMLQFMGLEPVLVFGKLETESMTHAAPHAFLVISGRDGSELIFDPMNPHLVFKVEKLVRTLAAIYKADDLLARPAASVEVTKPTYSLVGNEAVLEKESKYIFTNSFFSPDLHPN